MNDESTTGDDNPSTKEEYQKRVINYLHRNGTHAVATRDDTQLQVFINEDTGELNVWPTSRIEPYEIQNVFPLPEEAYFDCWALVSPDWSEVEI